MIISFFGFPHSNNNKTKLSLSNVQYLSFVEILSHTFVLKILNLNLKKKHFKENFTSKYLQQQQQQQNEKRENQTFEKKYIRFYFDPN